MNEETRNKISIIIPVYNVSDFIDECIQSLLKQTYKNYEIILVDDGSTDDSGFKCDGYAQKYANIKIIHQINSGVSYARNVGISKSTGDYIVFVDPDDTVSEIYLEVLISNILFYQVDLCACKYTIKQDFLEQDKKEYTVKTYESETVFNKMLAGKNFDGYVWNKIFKRDIIIKNKINFPENIKVWEDMYFVLKYIKYAEKLVYIKNKLYYYRVRKNSSTSQQYSEIIDSKLKVCKLFLELDSGCKKKYYKYAIKLYLENLIDFAIFYINDKNKVDSTINLIKQENLLKKSKLSVKYQIKFLSIKFKRKAISYEN